MRTLAALSLFTLAVPAAATAGGLSPSGDQVTRTDSRSGRTPCQARDKDRTPREVARSDCRVNKPVPPIVDPTPIFIL